jgi:hypothetical protein
MSTGATAISAPGGCDSIKMESDGSVFRTHGGVIDVPDEYSSELRASNAVRNGILSMGRAFTIGTKVGMVCSEGCSQRVWQAWTKQCPGCHAPTRAA